MTGKTYKLWQAEGTDPFLSVNIQKGLNQLEEMFGGKEIFSQSYFNGTHQVTWLDSANIEIEWKVTPINPPTTLKQIQEAA